MFSQQYRKEIREAFERQMELLAERRGERARRQEEDDFGGLTDSLIQRKSWPWKSSRRRERSCVS